MSRRLHVDRVAAGPQALSGDEAHYARDVLRLVPGDRVTLFDDDGQEAPATVLSVSRHEVTLLAEGPRAAAPTAPAVVILGVPRPSLVDEAITLGTEAGATAFWLFRAERSQVDPPRVERLERVARAAARQCRRGGLPSLRVLGGLGEALAEANALGLPRLVGDPRAEVPVPACPGGVVLSIGPEGGFTPTERQAHHHAGFVGARLGTHVLRAPTAVAVGLGLALSRW